MEPKQRECIFSKYFRYDVSHYEKEYFYHFAEIVYGVKEGKYSITFNDFSFPISLN